MQVIDTTTLDPISVMISSANTDYSRTEYTVTGRQGGSECGNGCGELSAVTTNVMALGIERSIYRYNSLTYFSHYQT